MTVTFTQLGLYALAMAGLWVIPGPVWVALTARTLTGGFASAWPLAVGVALGDVFWPLAAIFGLTWILSIYGDFLALLRWVAAVVFVVMGVMLIRKPAEAPSADGRLTRPGRAAPKTRKPRSRDRGFHDVVTDATDRAPISGRWSRRRAPP